MIVLAKIGNEWFAGERNYDNWRLGKVPNLPGAFQYRAEELYYETPNGEFACLKNRYARQTLLSKQDAALYLIQATPINWKQYTVNTTSSAGPG